MKVTHLPFDTLNPYQSELCKALERIGVEISVLPPHPFLPVVSSLWKCPDLDIVHLHWLSGFIVKGSIVKSWFWAVLFCAELLLVKLRGKKLVWTVHNLGEHDARHPVFERFVLKVIVKILDKIIVHNHNACETITQVFKGLTKDKISTIPHGHYLECYPNTVTRGEARGSLGLPDKGKVFLFMGQIRAYKGLDQLLAAFHDPAFADATLLIVGKPHSEDLVTYLRNISKPLVNVRFVFEFIDVRDIQRYMNAADCAVFPFREIFTSGSVMLALGFDLPVIVPRTPSLAEICEEACVIGYDPSDSDGLLGALKEAMAADFSNCKGENKAYAKCFDWQTVAKLTEAVYQDVISTPL